MIFKKYKIQKNQYASLMKTLQNYLKLYYLNKPTKIQKIMVKKS